MSGTDNLIPMTQRTKEEARLLSIKGGVKSGETRRAQRTLRQIYEQILKQPVIDKELAKKLSTQTGIDEKEIDNKMALALSMYRQAIKGNINAYKAIESSIGEQPVQKIEANISDDNAKLMQGYMESLKR